MYFDLKFSFSVQKVNSSVKTTLWVVIPLPFGPRGQEKGGCPALYGIWSCSYSQPLLWVATFLLAFGGHHQDWELPPARRLLFFKVKMNTHFSKLIWHKLPSTTYGHKIVN
jgi:hypothetical protein